MRAEIQRNVFRIEVIILVVINCGAIGGELYCGCGFNMMIFLLWNCRKRRRWE